MHGNHASRYARTYGRTNGEAGLLTEMNVPLRTAVATRKRLIYDPTVHARLAEEGTP